MKNNNENEFAAYAASVESEQQLSHIEMPANANEQRAASLACCAYEKYKRGEVLDYNELNPVYLKKSQAERELEERNKN